jgi:hypothetical protein
LFKLLDSQTITTESVSKPLSRELRDEFQFTPHEKNPCTKTTDSDFHVRPIADEVGNDKRAALPGDGAMLYDGPKILQFRHYKETLTQDSPEVNGQLAVEATATDTPLLQMGNLPEQAKVSVDEGQNLVSASCKQNDDRIDSVERNGNFSKFPGHPDIRGDFMYDLSKKSTACDSKLVETDPKSMASMASGFSYWSKPLIDQIVITDVTTNFVTVTVQECLTDKGFFKERQSNVV